MSHRTCLSLASVVLLAALAATAGASSIGTPSPANSTVPSSLRVVGWNGGFADPQGRFTVVVRSLANVPIAGSRVIVDFSSCTDAQIALTQYQAGTSLDCSLHWVWVFTDAAGQAVFDIVGAARTGGPAPLHGGSVRIYADGVQLTPTSLPVAFYDLDGSGGVSANDVSLWVGDYLSGEYRARSDYDASGALDANDLSSLVGVVLGGAAANSGAPYCP